MSFSCAQLLCPLSRSCDSWVNQFSFDCNRCRCMSMMFTHKEGNIHILMMFCSSIDRGSQQSKWLVIVLFGLEIQIHSDGDCPT